MLVQYENATGRFTDAVVDAAHYRLARHDLFGILPDSLNIFLLKMPALQNVEACSACR
jgi:hypothetical protein